MADQMSPAQIIGDPGPLLALEKTDPARAEELWHSLTREQRLRAVLAARGSGRQRLITLAADSVELTRALAPDEFAGSVLQMGQDDAGELIALSSDEQLTYLLDLTGWVKEMFAPTRYQAWIPLVLGAGPERVKRWLAGADLEVLALLFAHWFSVVKFLPSSEQQEPPDDLPPFTLDGLYHIDFRDESISALVAQVLVILKSELPELYPTVMESMLWESAAEISEYASRWRAGRLADHGFPTRLEALELWAAPIPGEVDWTKLQPKLTIGFGAEAPPRSDQFMDSLDSACTLPQLAAEMNPAEADSLRFELAYIANAAVVALDADPADPEAVKLAAREGLGLANLGLELVAGADQSVSRQVLRRVGLTALARQGAAAIRMLNQRAWVLLKEGWLAGLPTGLHLLDDPLDRWVAGLIFPRPRCYDPALGGGREYRPFLGSSDIDRATAGLAEAEFTGRLVLELIGIDRLALVEMLAAGAMEDEANPIKLSQVIATWLARRELGLEGLAPLTRARFNEAVMALKQGLDGPLADELMDSCAALPDPGEAGLAGKIMRRILARMSADLGRLDTSQGLDPDLVGLILVQP